MTNHGHSDDIFNSNIISGFCDIRPETLIDKKTVGMKFGRCDASVDRAVNRGELPPPIKVLGKQRWLVGAILEHFRELHAQEKRRAEEERKRLSEYMD